MTEHKHDWVMYAYSEEEAANVPGDFRCRSCGAFCDLKDRVLEGYAD